MIIKRIFIFLLSLFWVIQTPIALAAVTPFYGPFTTAPAAADIAGSLGAGGEAAGAGFGLSVAGAATAAAAVGVGVGAFCLASAAQGADACGAGGAICNALSAANIQCKPDSTGGFSYEPTNACVSSSCSQYLYSTGNAPNPQPIGTLISFEIGYCSNYYNQGCSVSADGQEPYAHLTFTLSNGQTSGIYLAAYNNSNYIPVHNDANPASANAVGNAIAKNPAAAAAVGAAAAAAAAAGCSGTYGTFNGATTCIAGLGASNGGACAGASGGGFSGVVNGQSLCVSPLGAGANPSCSGYSGTIGAGAATQAICVPAIGTNNPACNGAMGSYNGNPVCIGGSTSPADQASANAQTAAAINAANAAASNPPATRTCASGYTLDASGLCLNPAIPNSVSGCSNGYVMSAGACVAADPLNPSQPASSKPADPSNPASPSNPVFPAFCGWAAVVCDLVNFIKTEPTQSTTDTTTPINDQAPQQLQSFDMNRSYFNFGSQCPADKAITFSILGRSNSLNLTWQPLCNFLTNLRPFIIGTAFIAGAFIVGGVQRPSGGEG